MNETEAALKRAHAAAERGDPKEMLEAIALTPLLDGIVRQLRGRWRTIPADLIEDIVGDAVDQLYQKIREGGKVSSIPGFVVKTAEFMAVDLYADLMRKDEFEPENLRHLREQTLLDQTTRPNRSTGPRTNWHMTNSDGLPSKRPGDCCRSSDRRTFRVSWKLSSTRCESGREDISNAEIAEMTGLKPGTVATLKHRGFKRLTDLSEKEGPPKVFQSGSRSG